MKSYVETTVTMFDKVTLTGNRVTLIFPLKSKGVSPNLKKVLRALKMRWEIDSSFDAVTSILHLHADSSFALPLEGFFDYLELSIMEEVKDTVGADRDRTKSVAMKAFLYNNFYLEITESIPLKESKDSDDFE